MRTILTLALLATTAACGQTGALYLPDKSIETPVEIRTQSETDKNKDEDKKATQPPGR